MPPSSPFRSPNPHRLYRHPERGRVFGVCAGLADYFGVEPFLVRLGALAGLVFFFVPVFLGYLMLTVILPRRPADLYRSPDEEEFWRAVATKPAVTLSAVRHRYRALESRLRPLESYVATREFDLNRSIRDLERS
jgi:phage shock protein C